jgi:hypothetical protein
MKGLVAPGDGEALYQMAAQVPQDLAMVEVGAHRGLSTCWLALGAADGLGARVTSVDLWPWDGAPEDFRTGVEWAEEGAFQEWQAHLSSLGLEADHFRGSGVEAAAQWKGPQVGFLFHDAGHSYEDVRQDYLAWRPHLAPGAWVGVHDYWGAVPDGLGGWKWVGVVQAAVAHVILREGSWSDVEVLGEPFGDARTTPNLWRGRRA